MTSEHKEATRATQFNRATDACRQLYMLLSESQLPSYIKPTNAAYIKLANIMYKLASTFFMLHLTVYTNNP